MVFLRQNDAKMMVDLAKLQKRLRRHPSMMGILLGSGGISWLGERPPAATTAVAA